MIVSVSRRSDVPCYYAEWFMERVRQGEVMVRNPINALSVSRVLLTPKVVDFFVFWSKDPAKLMPYLGELDQMGYRYYFQFTLTPYGRELEPGLREKGEIVETFKELSRMIGGEKIVWRYDPIILGQDRSMDWHREKFGSLCRELCGSTGIIMFSFVDIYRKLERLGLSEVGREEMEELSAFIGATARENGMEARVCCEEIDREVCHLGRGACVDRELMERISGKRLGAKADKNQRPGCLCVESIDIGAYNTCPNGCVYCYANRSMAGVEKACKSHRPGDLLLGSALSGREKITDRKMRSLLD